MKSSTTITTFKAHLKTVHFFCAGASNSNSSTYGAAYKCFLTLTFTLTHDIIIPIADPTTCSTTS